MWSPRNYKKQEGLLQKNESLAKIKKNKKEQQLWEKKFKLAMKDVKKEYKEHVDKNIKANCNDFFKYIKSWKRAREAVRLEHIDKLKISKSPWPNGIHSRGFFKKLRCEIAALLTKICNLSFKSDSVAEHWKVAEVTPIFKKGSGNLDASQLNIFA